MKPTQPTEQYMKNIRSLTAWNYVLVILAPPAGLIVALYTQRYWNKIGIKSGANKIAIILSIIFSLFMAGVIIYSQLTAAPGPSKAEKNTAASLSTAKTVIRAVGSYQRQEGSYPTEYNQASIDNNIRLSKTRITKDPGSTSYVEFYSCGDQGNAVGYWDYVKLSTEHLYVGSVTSLEGCTLVTK